MPLAFAPEALYLHNGLDKPSGLCYNKYRVTSQVILAKEKTDWYLCGYLTFAGENSPGMEPYFVINRHIENTYRP